MTFAVVTNKVRRWCFTLNNYNDDDITKLRSAFSDAEQTRYAVFGYEIAPHTNTPHLQGFVYFKTQKLLSAVRSIVQAHWSNAMSSDDANIKYCIKEGKFEEFGIRPKLSRGKRTDIDRAKAIIDNGGSMEDVKEQVFTTWLKYRAGLQAHYLQVHNNSNADAPGTRGIWIYGPPRIGKSYQAQRLSRLCAAKYGTSVYMKQQNKWWDGYQNEAVILLEDYDQEAHGHNLKIWLDRYHCVGETKGGQVVLRHRMFVITSNYHPCMIFKDETMCKAIMERCELVHMDRNCAPEVHVPKRAKVAKSETDIERIFNEFMEAVPPSDDPVPIGPIIDLDVEDADDAVDIADDDDESVLRIRGGSAGVVEGAFAPGFQWKV